MKQSCSNIDTNFLLTRSWNLNRQHVYLHVLHPQNYVTQLFVTVPLHTDFYMMMPPESFSSNWTAPKAKFSLCWTHLHPSPLLVACHMKHYRYQHSSPMNHWNVFMLVLLDVTCTFHNLLNHMVSQYHSHMPEKWPQRSHFA
jgi:hypothetical protein